MGKVPAEGRGLTMEEHLDACPMAHPWLYNLDEDIECNCDDLRADMDSGEEQ